MHSLFQLGLLLPVPACALFGSDCLVTIGNFLTPIAISSCRRLSVYVRTACCYSCYTDHQCQSRHSNDHHQVQHCIHVSGAQQPFKTCLQWLHFAPKIERQAGGRQTLVRIKKIQGWRGRARTELFQFSWFQPLGTLWSFYSAQMVHTQPTALVAVVSELLPLGFGGKRTA